MRAERRHERCLNCGAPTPGEFCGACGQRNADLHASFGELAVDLLSEAFEADSRLLRTVGPFLFKPGFLTQEHNAGRRVRYSSPLRLYLFCSFAFFLALSFMHGAGPQVTTGPRGVNIGWHVGDGAADAPDGGPAIPADGGALAAQDGGPVLDDRPLAEIFPDAGPLHVTSLGPLNHRLEERVESLRHMPGSKREEFVQKMGADFISNLPKAVFVLLPLFALLLKVFFWRSGKFYVEHLTFSFHVHAFAFLLLLLPLPFGNGYLTLACLLGVPLYVLLALRRVYANGWALLLLKSVALSALYFALVTLAISATVIASLLLG